MTDRELIEAIRRGDRAAFGTLIARYQRMVEAVAYHATGSAALVDDVVQDTFIVAWSTIERLHDPQRVSAWLHGIAKNLARKAHRRVRRQAAAAPDVAGERTPFD